MARKTTITQSPHFEEIYDLLISGWSPTYVHRYLLAQYGDSPDVPSLWVIRRYRDSRLGRGSLIPTSLVRQALDGRRYRPDTLKLLDDLIWAQEQRIGALWKREQETDKPNQAIANEIRVLVECAERRHKIALDLGVERPRTARLERNNTEVLEMPEAHLQELLAIFRQSREEREQRYGPALTANAESPTTGGEGRTDN